METADQIGLAFALSESLEQLFCVMEIVDQHKGIGGIGPGIESKRGAAPVNRLLAFDPVIKRARSVTRAENKRSAAFAPDDIAVGLAFLLENILDDARQSFGTLAKHAFGRTNQIVLLVGLAALAGNGSGSAHRHVLIGRGDLVSLACGDRFKFVESRAE